MKLPDQPLRFPDRDAWRLWLQENHAAQKEAWLEILKAHASPPGIHLPEAVEEALCFGWIDGVMKRANADTYYLRFSPRQRGSLWAVSNQKRVARLIAEGKMTQAGLQAVKAAQDSGEWDAAQRREDTTSLPEDLTLALSGQTGAQANFERFPASQKKQLLHWIASAKSDHTRQKRIREVVHMAAMDDQADNPG